MVTVEVAERYIDVYYRARYPIDEEKQPLFWEAVKLLAVDIEADVSKYIDENENYCVKTTSDNFFHISNLEPGIRSTVELAKKIANEIREVESKPVSPADVFFLSKRVELLEDLVLHHGGSGAFYK